MDKEKFEEAQIIQELKDGNLDVIDKLYKKYENHVLWTAYNVLQDMQNAEEVKQDVFIKIFELLSAKKPLSVSGDLKAYLGIMTRNRSLNKMRSGKVYVSHNLAYGESLPQITTPVDDTDEERTRELTQALNELSPERKEALRLVVGEGMKYKEAAKITGTSPHTLKILVTKGLKSLRSKFDKKFLLLL